jgi:membrane protein
MLSHFRIPIGWGELLKRTGQEAMADDILSLAAQQAYYFFFALFPALLALVSFASFFPLQNLVSEVVIRLGHVVPGDVIDIIRGQLEALSEDRAGGLLTLGFVLALWTSSTALVSVCSTLNTAYDITESRPWWKVRLTAIALTIGLAFFILVSMALVIAGPGLAERVAAAMHMGPAFEWTWKILQWPLVFVLVATGVALVYYFAPDAEQDWVWITPGSVLATMLWLAASLGLKFYIGNFGNYNETYGAIGTVMVLMLWFYVSGLAILIGAELNAEIEHASPYGKEAGEKAPGEKKVIGPRAARLYEERRAKGEPIARPFPDDVNCDLDRAPAPKPSVRPSELIVGAAALLPVALKIGSDIMKKETGGRRQETGRDGTQERERT